MTIYLVIGCVMRADAMEANALEADGVVDVAPALDNGPKRGVICLNILI